jgi:hypothetical protein
LAATSSSGIAYLTARSPLMPTYGCQRLNSEKWTNICIPTWSGLSHSENWPHMLA